jgi:hypothetical protein
MLKVLVLASVLTFTSPKLNISPKQVDEFKPTLADAAFEYQKIANLYASPLQSVLHVLG